MLTGFRTSPHPSPLHFSAAILVSKYACSQLDSAETSSQVPHVVEYIIANQPDCLTLRFNDASTAALKQLACAPIAPHPTSAAP